MCKCDMAIKELSCKSALNKVSGKFPYSYDLNIYRGCSHGCKYCYALYSHKFLDNSDFYYDVYYKRNILPLLDRELGRLGRDKIVNIGSVCDSYQGAERELELMPKVLEIFIKHRAPVIISTKSDLILRDIELIDRLSEITYVNIAASVITTKDSLAKIIEPGAVPPGKRIAMLKRIKEETKASTGLHCMPILPYITDDEENLRNVFEAAKEARVNYLLTGGLNMRGETGSRLTAFVKERFPKAYPNFISLKNKEERQRYKAELSMRLKALYAEYGLSSNYQKHIDERLEKQTCFSFTGY